MLQEPSEQSGVVGIVGGIVGIAGFVFGLYQYYIGQRWKRSEFATKQLDEFYDDPEILFCREVLDYRVRLVGIPPRFREMFADRKTFEHNEFKLVLAMTSVDWESCKNPDILIYRDCFDRMFLKLESISHYLEIGLFAKRDIKKLDYWLDQLAKPRFIENTDLFIRFLKSYNYFGVLKLMRELKVPY